MRCGIPKITVGKDSNIEWTDDTFNPWEGCAKVSPGCEHCYAELIGKRTGRVKWGKGQPRTRTSPATWENPLKWNEEAESSRRRRRVFCASMADVFDSEVDPQWREDLWEVVRKTGFLDWLILTKRPENIRAMLPPDWGDGWPNVCLMTSVEDQERAGRVAELIEAPSLFRGLSMEPLLGPVTLKQEWLEKLDWVIVGGESGRARPMHPDWVRALQEQCAQAGVKFFFKQWGCWSPDKKLANTSLSNVAFFNPGSDKPVFLSDMEPKERRSVMANPGDKVLMFRADKKQAGKLLDGQRYRNHPFGKKIPDREIVSPLSKDERAQLASCEMRIREGLGTFVDVGTALMEIRNAHLYRGTHPNFEAYVQSVLALSRPRAYQLIDSAQVMQDLSTIVDIPLPQNEAQARELRRWKTPEERVEKWKTVVSAAGAEPLTAEFIRHSLRAPQPTTPDTTVAKMRACLARLRGLAAACPVDAEALELIARLEQIIEDTSDGRRLPEAVPHEVIA